MFDSIKTALNQSSSMIAVIKLDLINMKCFSVYKVFLLIVCLFQYHKDTYIGGVERMSQQMSNYYAIRTHSHSGRAGNEILCQELPGSARA